MAELQDLGSIGKLNPFFLKRALGMEVRSPRTPNRWKQTLRDLINAPISRFSRITARFVFVDMQLCKHCSFIQTSIPFQDDEIGRLYVDYRSPSYHEQRTRYEPEYAAIAAAVGLDPLEIRTRTTALKRFLEKHVRMSETTTILDYGGSDGRFIPAVPGTKLVYEISNVEPISGVTRIKSEAELGTYSVVLLAHVTEHVTHPLKLVEKLSSYLQPGGHLYIETPQEIPDEQRAELQSGRARFDIPIHEHINSYCPSAVSALLAAGGYEVVATEATPVDIGWAQGVHLRALGQKPR